MRIRRKISAAVLLVVGSLPASAFDCADSVTTVEKAICADRALKDVDDQLEQAYGEVKALSTTSEQRMLARAQKSWIAERERNCPQSALGLSGCIADMTAARVRLFEGRPESGPGSRGRIIPVFVVQEGTEKQYDLDLTLLRFADPATPGEKLFNTLVDDVRSRVKLGEHGEDTQGHIYALEEAMTLSYASPDFMSVMHSFWANLGGAHGNGGVSNTNIDMTSGKKLDISDVFSEQAASSLAAKCKNSLIAEKRQRWGSEPYDPASDTFLKDDVIAEHVATLSRWSFTEREASVSFDAYAIGPYAEGSYDCTFDMKDVKALALPGAPLP